MSERAKAKQIQVEVSGASSAGTLQELIEDRKIYRPANIEVTPGEYDVEIASSTGTPGTIPAATITTAGAMSKDDKEKVNGLPDAAGLAAALDTKVDKVPGEKLITDDQATKLDELPTNDALGVTLGNKVDKVTGSKLITNGQATKLDELPTNEALGVTLGNKVDKAPGYTLVSDADADKLAGLPDNATLSATLGNKVDKVSGSKLITNAQATKLDELPEKSELDTTLDGKVDKEQGRSLIDDGEALKLADLPTAAQLSDALDAKVDAETGKGLIYPSPLTGALYGQKDGVWTEIPAGGGTGDVEEAPIDGKQYARKDAAWEEVVASGGGGDVEEAPADGKLYGRKDAGWTEVVVEAGILALDFDQEALLLAGKDWPLFDDFPDHTKNYKGYIYNDSEGTFFPYTATFLPSYGGIAEAVTVEVFPDANVSFNFSYITVIVEEYFGPDPVAVPVSATPFYSARTTTGLPAGVTSLSILYQIENRRDVSIAGIKVSIAAGNKDVPISIDLESITPTSSEVFGMPIDFNPQPFTPSFSDSLGHGLMELAVVGITTLDVGYKVRLVDYDLIITSDSDVAHGLDIPIPAIKRGFSHL